MRIAWLFLTAAAAAADFPGAQWDRRDPAALGVDAAKLEELAANLGGRGCVVKNGYVVKSWGSKSERGDWYSSAKPVLSTLLLFAVQEGKVKSVDTPIRQYGWPLEGKDREITFRHLANMMSGYARLEAPGAAFAYNDYAIQLYQVTLFDRVFKEAPQTAAMHPRRLRPLQFEDGPRFLKNRRLSASVRDFARIAWFWLQKGNWRGKQLLPRRFFEECQRPQVPAGLPHTAKGETNDWLRIGSYGGGSDHFTEYGAGIYGFNWWFNGTGRLHPGRITWPDAPRDAFMSIGAAGNSAVVIPSLNTVLVAARANWGSLRPGDENALANLHMRLLVDALRPAAPGAPEENRTATLFADDFSRYPPGWLSTPVGMLNAAIQEYHYLPHRGVPLEPWANPIGHQDSWVAGDEDGQPYLEQHLTPDARQFATPLFITGDEVWRDYTVEAQVKPLSAAGMAGVVFRYRTNRHYYLFALTGGSQARLALHLPLEKALRERDWKELGTVAFAYDTDRYYTLRVENSGARIRAFVDGKLLIEAADPELPGGRAGLAANIPARYRGFRVLASEAGAREIRRRIAAREAVVAGFRELNPKPKLWKKFDTPGFGAGRNVRFGDLDGDGQTDLLIAQNIPRVRGDAFDAISCLTAVSLDGKVLWQSGRPDPRNGLLTNDTPFQIHDVDGDGKNDVALVRDFKLQILEGATGRVRRWTWMPKAPGASERPYERVAGDSLAFVNVSGDPARREILVKDRYQHFWVFNNRLELLWKGQGQVGHFPFPSDVDGDGRDEIAIGYALWDDDGRLLWSHDRELKDHSDAIAVANLSPDGKAEPRVYSSGSDEGLLIFDLRGKLLKQVRVGHNQSPSIGDFRPDLPGLEYFSINFWKNPGIVTLFDRDGGVLAQGEPVHTGSPMLPVNWRGDGEEFVLLSGNPREGGMLDGRLRRVVMFPEDGHPDLAANVLDLTGDARDEVVLWDQQRVWIYTQDRPFRGARIYAPRRSPDYNESNYRTAVSLPRWKPVETR